MRRRGKQHNSRAPAFPGRPCGALLSSVPLLPRPAFRPVRCCATGLLACLTPPLCLRNGRRPPKAPRQRQLEMVRSSPCKLAASAACAVAPADCPWPSSPGPLFKPQARNPQISSALRGGAALRAPEAPSRLCPPPVWRKDMLCRGACRRTRRSMLPRAGIWTRSGGRCSRETTRRTRSGTKARCAAHHAHKA